MRHCLAILLTLLSCAPLRAQEDNVARFQPSLPPQPALATAAIDSVAYLGFAPTPWSLTGSWAPHEGLNLSLSASVFAEVGKHARHGAGFAQSLAALYAVPIAKDVALNVGAYLTNTTWQHASQRQAGVSAALAWRISERWEASLYGQKRLVGDDTPRVWGVWPGYGYNPMYDDAAADRIGAAVKYNVSPAFSFTLSVENVWLHDRAVPVTPWHGNEQR